MGIFISAAACRTGHYRGLRWLQVRPQSFFFSDRQGWCTFIVYDHMRLHFYFLTWISAKWENPEAGRTKRKSNVFLRWNLSIFWWDRFVAKEWRFELDFGKTSSCRFLCSSVVICSLFDDVVGIAEISLKAASVIWFPMCRRGLVMYIRMWKALVVIRTCESDYASKGVVFSVYALQIWNSNARPLLVSYMELFYCLMNGFCPS